MTAEEKIKQVMEKETTCPICQGTGIDPVQRSHKGPEPARCRRCKGNKTINRFTQIHKPGGPVDAIILTEQLNDNGVLGVQYQDVSVFAGKHRAILERPDPQLKMRDHLEEIKKGAEPIVKDCIDTWIAEGRM